MGCAPKKIEGKGVEVGLPTLFCDKPGKQLHAGTAKKGDPMRLDKFLKVSRLIKRRTVANEACDAGRVLVNEKPAKASAKVKPGDVIEIQFGSRNVKGEVLSIAETVRKEEAENLYRYL